MAQPAAHFSAPSLSRAVVGFVCLGALLAAIMSTVLVRGQIQDRQDQALAQAVEVRARGATLAFARAIHEDWQDTRMIADAIAFRHPTALRTALDLVVGDGSRVSWAGFARSDGTVANASGGLLTGQDVSSRPWFQRGLEGDFAGDVHEAVLLADLLPPLPDDEPRRFLDLATPVLDADDRPAGVLGLHIDFGWAQGFLLETARALDIDLFLLSQSGEVIIATDGQDYGQLNLASTRAAAIGAQAGQLEQWPDGQSYFTTVVPQVLHGDLPSFGWRMIARIDGDAHMSGMRDATTQLFLVLAGFGIALAGMTYVFVQFFTEPFGKIAENALSIADGTGTYPVEMRRTSEMQKLSAALARLQGSLPANATRQSSGGAGKR